MTRGRCETPLNDEKLLRWRTDFHKALSNPIRLQIVESLLKGERCQCEIFPEIGLSQSSVSAYLSQLVRAGILNVRRDGTRKLYSIATPRIFGVLASMHDLATETLA